MNQSRTSYLTTVTESNDQAESLAFYLGEHGVAAMVQDTIEVVCPILTVDDVAVIDLLKRSWAMFWETSDSGLLGLACYEKP
ncbi:hypothetical protein SEA_SKOG_154 [Gordonia phage Skog]|uniref:Uncharacterized protein n=1 Tax=Gordonia phage Skog TaxID=2704033 RepID=A0A6G6XJV3_9CAUD|nr:hypothetical protein KHQ85_gp154 [Gordonia phage Skog]QIG58306.1 hypothetical protein SEA_SKOG_154 [Gordonia phage Skog]